MKQITHDKEFIVGEYYWYADKDFEFNETAQIAECKHEPHHPGYNYLDMHGMRMWCWHGNSQVLQTYNVYGPIPLPGLLKYED